MYFKGEWRVGDKNLCVARVQDKVVKHGVQLDKKYNGHLTPEKKLVEVGEATCSLLRGRGGSPTTFTSVLR